MQKPTTTQLRTAIEVLLSFAERLDIEAAHSVMQLPQTNFGDDYAARIEARTSEETVRIKSIAGQLKGWSKDLNQATEQPCSYHV